MYAHNKEWKMYTDNIEGQSAFQVHHIHHEFVEKYAHLWENVLVDDSIVVWSIFVLKGIVLAACTAVNKVVKRKLQ